MFKVLLGLFFMSIMLYIGISNGDKVAQIFNAGGPQLVDWTKALQGRS